MLQKFKYGLLCAGVLFGANCLAMTHNLTPGLGMEFELAPNDPQTFKNSWFWSITATCTTSGEDNSDEIFVEALSKTGKVNGENIAQGDTLSIIVHPGDKFTITADSGAKVKLTNKGKNTVFASCSV